MKNKIFVLSILSLILGYAIGIVMLKDFLVETPQSAEEFIINISNPGIKFFFQNNILFFLLISVLPILNIFIMIFQLLITGLQIAFVQDLPLVYQIDFFYRHLIFEYVALLSAVMIGSQLFALSEKILHKERINNKEYSAKIFGGYFIVFICTIIAAFLEGRIHV